MAKLIFKIFSIEPGNPANCTKCNHPVKQEWYVIANYELQHDFTLDWVFEKQTIKIPLGVYSSEKNAKRAFYKRKVYSGRAPHEIEFNI